MRPPNPFDNEQFTTFAENWLRHVAPNIAESACVVSIAPEPGVADIKIAVEIGYALLLNKPLIVVVADGREPSERLRRVADHVISADIKTEAGQKKLTQALDRIIRQ